MNLRRRVGGPKLLAALLAGGSVCLIWFAVCAGLAFPFQMVHRLAVGWAYYLGRVAPDVRPDPWVVATAVVCLAGVAVGTHRFARWLYAATSDEPRRWRRKWTALLVGLVVLTFAAGTAFTGIVHQTGWLIRSPEPLTKSREPTLRIVSSNNLKQMGLAAHNYEEVETELPRSRFDPTGRPLHSWQTAALPYLEQEALYRRIDFSKPWTDPANASRWACESSRS
jgi:hypothetical protein